MAITLFGTASAPADNGSAGSDAVVSVTPPASMVVGDLVFVSISNRVSSGTLSVNNAAGQSWASLSKYTGTNIGVQGFWCRFNGTWSNPTVDLATSATGTVPLTATMLVFRPTVRGSSWAVDVAQTTGTGSTTTMTATGVTPTAASTVAIASFTTSDDNTLGSLSGTGWVLATFGGANQVRNTSGSDQAAGAAYKIQTSAAATGNVSLGQATLGADSSAWGMVVFAETAPPTSADLVLRLSGGASNSSQAAAIGGAMSTTTAATSSLFPNVTGAESAGGVTQYRCVYLHNPTSGTIPDLSVWIGANTPSTDTAIAIGLGAAAVGGTETAVANENTAPASVTFTAATSASRLSIGSLAAGENKAIWIRRTVSAGAAAYSSDGFTLSCAEAMVLTTFGPWGDNASPPGTAAFLTGSFVPVPNSIMVVHLAVMENGGNTLPQGSLTISAPGLTFSSPHVSAGDADPWSSGGAVWTAPVGSSPSALQITFDAGSRDIYFWAASVSCLTNYDTTTPIGGKASDSLFATDGPDSLTLDATPEAASYILAFQVQSCDPTMTDATPGSGWSDLVEKYATYLNLHGQFKTGHTSTTVPWDDVRVGGVAFRAWAMAVEVKSG